MQIALRVADLAEAKRKAPKIAEPMGHTYDRPALGTGVKPSLKAEVMARMAL